LLRLQLFLIEIDNCYGSGLLTVVVFDFTCTTNSNVRLLKYSHLNDNALITARRVIILIIVGTKKYGYYRAKRYVIIGSGRIARRRLIKNHSPLRKSRYARNDNASVSFVPDFATRGRTKTSSSGQQRSRRAPRVREFEALPSIKFTFYTINQIHLCDSALRTKSVTRFCFASSSSKRYNVPSEFPRRDCSRVSRPHCETYKTVYEFEITKGRTSVHFFFT